MGNLELHRAKLARYNYLSKLIRRKADLGTTAGRTFDYGDGRMIQPYLRAAVAHEFVNGNQVRVNGNSFHNDLAGTRAELGAGVVAAWSQQWQAHAEFDYANGERLEQPWGVSVGVRYNW
ncbi:autotransporter outer membrane beta-barrel domain-containing protein [Pseudomonas putida]|nr:autotransporter outer membrane beta-barrel domain-containing protein [Pseudomonas putida]